MGIRIDVATIPRTDAQAKHLPFMQEERSELRSRSARIGTGLHLAHDLIEVALERLPD
jgi:hypothetical protein